MMYSLEAEMCEYYPANPTIKNVDKGAYNCGGYATGCFHWYLPYDSYDERKELENLIAAGKAHLAANIMVQHIMKDFDYCLIEAHDITNLYKSHEIIAFRITDGMDIWGDWDFHFLKLGLDKNWYEKRGGSYTISRHPFHWGFDIWHERYDGEIHFLAKKRP